MTGFALLAQRAAEQRLEMLEDLLGRECVGEEVEWPETLLAPYCGCLTCQVREVLGAAWEVFVDAGIVGPDFSNVPELRRELLDDLHVRHARAVDDSPWGGRPPPHGEAGSRRPAEARDKGSKPALPTAKKKAKPKPCPWVDD